MKLRRVFPLVLLAFLATTSVFGQDLSAEQKQSVLKSIQETLNTRAFVPGVDFKKWDEFVAKKKEDIDKDADVASFTRTINQALRDFGISHCRLQTPRATSQRGKTTTIGSGFQGTVEEKGIRVRRVTDGSPAKQAGIEEKDLIVKVNGEKPSAADVVTGEKGAKFQLQVEKPNGETKDIEIELKEFSTVRKETLTWINPETAVLRLYTFSFGYDRANIESLVSEANGKAKTLIIDLRSNGGGAVNNLNHFLSLLLPDSTDYGTFVTKKLMDDYTKAKPDGPMTPESMAAWAPRKAKTKLQKVAPFSGKLGVLINRGSASASEICTAALREKGNAKVFGTQSAGAVLSSIFVKLTEGFSIQIPVSDYITVNGTRLEANPIKPDVEVTAVRKEGEDDPVITKAIEVLKGN